MPRRRPAVALVLPAGWTPSPGTCPPGEPAARFVVQPGTVIAAHDDRRSSSNAMTEVCTARIPLRGGAEAQVLVEVVIVELGDGGFRCGGASRPDG